MERHYWAKRRKGLLNGDVSTVGAIEFKLWELKGVIGRETSVLGRDIPMSDAPIKRSFSKPKYLEVTIKYDGSQEIMEDIRTINLAGYAVMMPRSLAETKLSKDFLSRNISRVK